MIRVLRVMEMTYPDLEQYEFDRRNWAVQDGVSDPSGRGRLIRQVTMPPETVPAAPSPSVYATHEVPDGHAYRVRIEPVGDGRWRVLSREAHTAYTLNGTYDDRPTAERVANKIRAIRVDDQGTILGGHTDPQDDRQIMEQALREAEDLAARGSVTAKFEAESIRRQIAALDDDPASPDAPHDEPTC